MTNLDREISAAGKGRRHDGNIWMPGMVPSFCLHLRQIINGGFFALDPTASAPFRRSRCSGKVS